MAATRHSIPPVLILCGQIAALALARRLGRAGVDVGIWDTPDGQSPAPPALASRHVRWRFFASPQSSDEERLASLERAAAVMGARPVLLPTSDEAVQLLSRGRARLRARFRFLLPPAAMLEQLMDKRQLHRLAAGHGVAVPRARELTSPSDLAAAADEIGFPCLLKSAYSHAGAGVHKASAEAGKQRCESWAQLQSAYRRMAGLDARLLLQEYLVGGPEQVALYNAYFNASGEAVAVFTGRKRRQWPLEFGTASMSEACPMPGLAAPLTAMLTRVGYCGPIDIGLKRDARTGQYKLLDVNPRLGQNYRTFVAAGPSRADLGWLAYAEVAGLALPPGSQPLKCRRRRWKIEDSDFRSCWQLRREGAWTGWGWAADWLRWHAGAHERAYWSWRDPAPFWSQLRRGRMLLPQGD